MCFFWIPITSFPFSRYKQEFFRNNITLEDFSENSETT